MVQACETHEGPLSRDLNALQRDIGETRFQALVRGLPGILQSPVSTQRDMGKPTYRAGSTLGCTPEAFPRLPTPLEASVR